MQRSGSSAPGSVDVIQAELAMLVRRAVRATVLHTGDRVHRLDVASFALLGLISDSGPQRSGDLARMFSLDKSTMSRQVAALDRAGLVERVDDPDDRRAFLVSLSAAGRDTLDEVRRERRRVYQELLAHWPEADRQDLARLLSKLNGDVQRLVAQRATATGDVADRAAVSGGGPGAAPAATGGPVAAPPAAGPPVGGTGDGRTD